MTITDKQLELHLERLVNDYFRFVPNSATPQLYLEKMNRVYGDLISLKQYDKFSDPWMSYNPKYTVDRWYNIIREDVRGVLLIYLVRMNRRMEKDKINEVFDIDSLLLLMKWIAKNEVRYG